MKFNSKKLFESKYLLDKRKSLSGISCNNLGGSYKKLLFSDFIDKVSWVEGGEGEKLLNEYKILELPKEYKQILANKKSKTNMIHKFDILIVGIKVVELHSILNSFGIDHNKVKENFIVCGNIKVYATKIFNKFDEEYTVAICILCEDTNVESSLNTAELLGKFEVKQCYLIGMAAGIQEKVALGDVVISKKVFYHEKGKQENGEFKNRIAYKESSHTSLSYFRVNDKDFSEFFCDKLKIIPGNEPLPSVKKNYVPCLIEGIISSGEKLLADSEYMKRIEDRDQQIKAVEMEGYGFALACNAKGIPWLIFRGISDMGTESDRGKEAEQSDNKDIWQYYATFSAAVAFQYFFSESVSLNEVKF